MIENERGGSMVFYENGRKVRYNPYNMKIDPMIGKGNEVIAYKVGSEVVKFYRRHCRKIRLTKEECEYLEKIDTERILLPTVTLLDKKHQIRGYKMNYIEELGKDSFYTLNRKDLSKEMSLVHKDVIKLSDYNVHIEDLNLDNTIFHNGIYLADPGSFLIDQELEGSNIRVYGFNMDMINEYLLNTVIRRWCLKVSKSITIAKRMVDAIQEDIEKRSLDTLTYLIDGMEYDSISELVLNKYNSLKSSKNGKVVGMQKVKK